VGPSAADAGMRLCGTKPMGRVPRGVPRVIRQGCEVIDEGSGVSEIGVFRRRPVWARRRVVSYLLHWSRAARPKLLQHRGCHKAAVMTEFTATRPPLHTLAQAVEDARGVWRRRCAARLARAASGMSQAPACSRRITQRREGDVPRQRIDCLGGGRRGWLDFKNGL
jgi:hypothetical protein